MLRLTLIILLILAPCWGSVRVIEGGIIGQEITSIDLYSALKVVYRGDMIATINKDGSVSIFKELKLLKTIHASSFAGLTTFAGTGADIYLSSAKYASVATFTKTDTGVAYCYINSIDLTTWEVRKLIGCGDVVSTYDGSPWVVFRTGNRSLHDDKFGMIFYLHLRKGNTNARELFRLSKDAVGKELVLPLPTSSLGQTPQAYNEYALYKGEVLYLSSVTNDPNKRVLKGYRLDSGAKREITQIPDECKFIDESGAEGFVLGCKSPGNRIFYRSTYKEGAGVVMSGILPRSASQPKPGALLNAFVGSSRTIENYFYTINSGEMLCLIDELNLRSVCAPVGEVNSEIVVIGSKVLMGTPKGTFLTHPTLITSISESSGVVQGTGINFSLPGFKSELLLNGTPVPGATFTETTFRASLVAPPSGAAEVSLRLTASDGAVAKSLNTAKVDFPVTVPLPEITAITPLYMGGVPKIGDQIAAGSGITIWGKNMSALTLPPPLDSKAQSLVEVLVDGLPIQLVSISPKQINGVFPQISLGKHYMKVRRLNAGVIESESKEFEINVVDAFAGFVDYQPENTNYRLLAIVKQDGSYVGPNNPLRPGEVGMIFGTGFGPTNDSNILIASPEIRFNEDSFAQVLYAGLAGCDDGSGILYQINFITPEAMDVSLGSTFMHIRIGNDEIKTFGINAEQLD